MVRTKDNDGIKSGLIVAEVQKRPCLYDTNHMNYGDRAEKMRSWDEVYEGVVPGWPTLGQTEKSAAVFRASHRRVAHASTCQQQLLYLRRIKKKPSFHKLIE
ncbi:jg4805 [Pararge aegeria aegeria]|uniref:Jg4805 protein n=1 Tax=Pararge aegeria aegeria TaxID=348720 RepID=A0A8S4R032_9NEOP|nr:jg4805 [Pararge aegeria aegeria]